MADPETNFQAQVVVIDQDQPAGLFALPKWAKSISGEVERNVPRIFKVLVRVRLTIDNNMGSPKPLIVSTIHNILEVGAIVLVFTSIQHGMSKLFVLVKGLEPWDERNIGELSLCAALEIEMWLTTIRTLRQIAVRTNKATTR